MDALRCDGRTGRMGKEMVLAGQDVVGRSTGKEGGGMTYTADSITILADQDVLAGWEIRFI
jgi:hypothetical protein